MPSTRKIIRAFIASPGDLQEERKAIRHVVDEFNESWANELGYQVELMGWEETVAGFGRPQHLINQDLDRCDLFLGMIWKRWGTPPDHDGEFSSGFEEEFKRSISRCEETGIPEISLFFKEIPKEFMVDPGDDLKKVLEFREKIIASKKILFQNFSMTRDIEALARKCVTAYVNRVRAADELSEPDELRAKRARTSSREEGGNESSPLSAEGFEFLENLVGRIRQPDSLDALSASDIARFRLLANSISKPGNEEMNLGVHDTNILSAARLEGMELGKREKYYLARLGFQHLAYENVPLWCWYSALADSQVDPAILSSFLGVDENEKVGAISVLTALALDLPTDDDGIKRDRLINAWFSDNSSTKVRVAALGYLAKCGTTGDLEIAKKEYDRSDYGTSRSALECMVEILLRTGQPKAAQELVLESQFETLNTDLLRSVLSGFEGLETSVLLLGLEHRNSQVRLCAMKSLHSRGALDIGMAGRLTGDSNAPVRSEAVRVLLKLGKPLAEEEVKKILVPPQKQSRPGLLGLASTADSDETGEELFQQYRLDVLKGLPEPELEKKVGASFMHDDAAYFALVERYFRSHVDELRRNIDDRFSTYFEERIRRIEAKFGDSYDTRDLVKKTRELEGFMRRDLTRRGLNVLCVAKKPEDLQRVRANLRDGFAGASKHEAEYLGRYGEWIDIPMLVNAEGPKFGVAPLTISRDEEFKVEVARAITSIGKRHSVSDLLSIGMPSAILKKTIELCAESRFAKISRDALLALFNHESDEVRKAAAVLTVRALSAKRIKSILREYVLSDNYRYYNVIHWLDLGASMHRDDARKVARTAGS
ncbi:DUF4062 domain-containing protein [Microbulbifer rhizosphaerae]|uniref:DUF4062 domain-containing protein n=1 Tax=Microbulbifer rhizosphaerae TaxID=1562603 RepID=A0A7W4Z9F2_9GAMM|nr:DUF4062 domain-containing protein [Microbulbifer rhizosphaerae]MBB3061768.1 hypothetical protein [Microbulbifer rhizosphaerae]